MTNPINVPSSAFNVERIRAEMMKDLAIPPDLLQRAIDKTYQKLEAKKTMFFAHRGEVVETAVVEDHATQMTAVDKILSMAGVYARERDSVPAQPLVAMEMDPRTGVVRLVIGQALPEAPLTNHQLAPQAPEVAALSPINGSVLAPKEPVESGSEATEPVVVKVRRGGLPIDVYNALFGEDGSS